MKAYLMVVASAAAALASCGSDGPENLAANVQAGDTNAQASDANAQNGLAEPADANSNMKPSPAVLNNRPPCFRAQASMRARRPSTLRAALR